MRWEEMDILLGTFRVPDTGPNALPADSYNILTAL